MESCCVDPECGCKPDALTAELTAPLDSQLKFCCNFKYEFEPSVSPGWGEDNDRGNAQNSLNGTRYHAALLGRLIHSFSI